MELEMPEKMEAILDAIHMTASFGGMGRADLRDALGGARMPGLTVQGNGMEMNHVDPREMAVPRL